MEEEKVKLKKLSDDSSDKLEKERRKVAQFEKRCKDLEQEKGEMAQELAALQSTKADSDKRRKNAEAQLVDLNSRLADAEGARNAIVQELTKVN